MLFRSRMAVADLRRTPPIRLERLVRVSRDLEWVALEQGDVVTIASKRDARRKSRDPGSDHCDTCHGRGKVAAGTGYRESGGVGQVAGVSTILR